MKLVTETAACDILPLAHQAEDNSVQSDFYVEVILDCLGELMAAQTPMLVTLWCSQDCRLGLVQNHPIVKFLQNQGWETLHLPRVTLRILTTNIHHLLSETGDWLNMNYVLMHFHIGNTIVKTQIN